MPGEIVATCLSPRKGIPKLAQLSVTLVEDLGVEGDRHAGSRTRQVSLMEQEVLDSLAADGMAVGPGVLGENLTVRGMSLNNLPIGSRLRIGPEALIEVTAPRTPCMTLRPVDPRLPASLFGRCGLLGKVVTGGTIRPGDTVELLA